MKPEAYGTVPNLTHWHCLPPNPHTPHTTPLPWPLPRDMRPVRWKFATGPLPGELPVDQLGTQWFLLSI